MVLVASASRGGEEAAEAATAVAVRLLQREKDTAVRSALLSALRSLAEDGQATSIGLHAHIVLLCLKDEDTSIQRKACALLRIVSEEGGAPLVARHVPEIIDCFKSNKRSLLAPMDTLAALAEAGEGQAVAQAVSTLVDALKDESSRVCIAACSTLAIIVTAGGGSLLRTLGQLEAASTPATTDPSTAAPPTLLELLVSLSLEAPDRECRLAAADALRCMVEADQDIREVVRDQYSFPLFSGIRNIGCDAEIREMLTTVLDLRDTSTPAPAPERENASHESTEDAEGEACAICCSCIRKDQEEALACGHCFHAECIGSWFEYQRASNRAQTCPLCRWRKDPVPKRQQAPAQPRPRQPPPIVARGPRTPQRTTPARPTRASSAARATRASSTARSRSPTSRSPTSRSPTSSSTRRSQSTPAVQSEDRQSRRRA